MARQLAAAGGHRTEWNRMERANTSRRTVARARLARDTRAYQAPAPAGISRFAAARGSTMFRAGDGNRDRYLLLLLLLCSPAAAALGLVIESN
jgi:hypothetical protein